ncbi:MAG: hypothetical protein IJV04_05770, partial [Lachnospiraceae bacterium]|nr:hypothetical protein [Lachnospiraceae bacterium]
ESLELSELDGILFAYGTIRPEQAKEVAALLAQEGIPFLVGDGDEIVEKGGLICLSFFDYEGYGHYAARVMNDIFHGEKASEQPCIYTSPSRIVVNLDAAEQTGFHMDLAFLRSASVIYRKR